VRSAVSARGSREVRHVSKWQLALQIIDDLLGSSPPPAVQVHGRHGDITAFGLGAEERDLK
jgi:hypothetical protein